MRPKQTVGRRLAVLSLAICLCAILPSLFLFGCSSTPDALHALRERNPETADFVDAYETEHDKHHTIDLSDDCTPGEIPLFLQWDIRWGYETYGSSIMALSGCGPTCLSMVLVGLTGDTAMDPLTVARFSEKNNYYVSGAGTAWALISEGAVQLGLCAEELPLDKEIICDRLIQGQPIICAVGPGDFTTEGHFIVLTGINDGRVFVNDPNSRRNSRQTWDVQQIMAQTQNLWALSPG